MIDRKTKKIIIYQRECPACGDVFETLHDKQVFCSTTCSMAIDVPRFCRTCGGEFFGRINAKKCGLCKGEKRVAYEAMKDGFTVIYECPCDADKKHRHHHAYDRKTEVLLLCPSCHKKEHSRLNHLAALAAQNSPSAPFEESTPLATTAQDAFGSSGVRVHDGSGNGDAHKTHARG